MNRREFVRSGMVVSVAAQVPLAAPAEAPRKRMNVLYVFGDQHRACSMPGQPYSPVVAPAFEAFAKDGFVMENCISNYPLCMPYRGIFMSGRWPQQTGLMRNGPDSLLSEHEHGLGQAFKDAGYQTAYVGKWHLYMGENHFVPKGPLRFGFDYWRVWGATNNHWHDYTWNPETGEKLTRDGWAPTLMTDQAIEFIGQQKKDKPWMMVVSWNPPHPPFNPPEEDAALYQKDKLPQRPNVAFKRSDGSTSDRIPLRSESNLREAERGYYGGITGIDKEFRRLLDALEKTGQSENTVVVFTSDHGEMMGSHCRMAKQVPWEESCHVPFCVRIPGAANRGRTSTDLMGTIDVYPTLCGLAGIQVPNSCQGRDLSAVMRGERQRPSEAVMIMNEDTGDRNDPEAVGYRGVRTLTHTYAVARDGRWLLYDNVADPYQQKNLVNDPKHKELMAKFDTMIFEWQKQTGDKFPVETAVSSISKQPS